MLTINRKDIASRLKEFNHDIERCSSYPFRSWDY